MDRLGVQDWAVINTALSFYEADDLESGPGHRPLNLQWARNIRDDCHDQDVAFFFKQVGGRTPTAGGDELDGKQYKAFPQ